MTRVGEGEACVRREEGRRKVLENSGIFFAAS